MVTRNFLVLLIVLLGVGCTPQCERNQFEPSKPYSKAISEFKSEDIGEGSGPELQEGDLVEVKFRGWIYDSNKSDGKGALVFDSYTDKTPLKINFGQDEILLGWQEGLLGMKIGGKRRLFIPSPMAYGDAGAGTIVPPKTDLIYEIEVLSIQSGSTDGDSKE
ncbi:MAG: hypothetical protein RJB66_1094 [Pseudomonadota bacterium]|jgi:FKBP-type peptidyl-prolyl cis-trans isomerase